MNRHYDVLSLGELLIDFVAQDRADSLECVTGFSKASGGAPANVAVGIARLGGCSAFSGRVGADPMGRFLKHTLDAYHVSTDLLQVDPAAPTPLAFVSLSESGERDFCFFRHMSADMNLVYSTKLAEALSDALIFHFGSFSMSAPKSRETTLSAVSAAKQNQTLISFDPNVRGTVWPDLDVCRENIFFVMDQVHLLKVSDEELLFLCGEDDAESNLRKLHEMGPEVIVVTKGKHGCAISVNGMLINVGNFPHKALDTTGAGDGFWSAFLFAVSRYLNKGMPLLGISEQVYHGIGVFSNAVATLVTQSYGAMSGLPDLPQVKAFLQTELETEQIDSVFLGLWDVLFE